jgi:putative transposase
MESFFSRLKIEGINRNRTRDKAKVDVFDYIERFHNPSRRRSTIRFESSGVRKLCGIT